MCTHIFLCFACRALGMLFWNWCASLSCFLFSLFSSHSIYGDIFSLFSPHPKCKRHLLRFFLAPKRQTTQHISFGLLLFFAFLLTFFHSFYPISSKSALIAFGTWKRTHISVLHIQYENKTPTKSTSRFFDTAKLTHYNLLFDMSWYQCEIPIPMPVAFDTRLFTVSKILNYFWC